MRSSPTTAVSATRCGRQRGLQHPDRRVRHLLQPRCLGHRGALSAERGKPYEEQYHNLLRRSIGKDYTYVEYNDSRTGEPYTDADTTHKSLGGYVQYNTFVSNGRSYCYIGQFVSSRYCFDFGTDENGTPCMTYYALATVWA